MRLLDGPDVWFCPHRARCRECRRTHVLLPAWCLGRRADAGEVIGRALEAKAAGAGHRTIAVLLGRPASTVRGWLRALAARAEQVRSVFTALAASLVSDPPLPAPAGSAAADAVAADAAAATVAARVPGWARYVLRRHAAELGWAEQQITVIDEDLARSVATTSGQLGFTDLVAAVGLGKVGIIVGREVSRLARNNTDWYQALDLCSITDTLIADADGIYHPAEFDDRLILGLKGQMAEALCRYPEKPLMQTSPLCRLERRSCSRQAACW